MAEWTSTCRWCGVGIGRAARSQEPLIWAYYNLVNGELKCRVSVGASITALTWHQPAPLPDLTDVDAVDAWLSN